MAEPSDTILGIDEVIRTLLSQGEPVPVLVPKVVRYVLGAYRLPSWVLCYALWWAFALSCWGEQFVCAWPVSSPLRLPRISDSLGPHPTPIGLFEMASLKVKHLLTEHGTGVIRTPNAVVACEGAALAGCLD